jgi:dihydroneopterin aldolase
MSVIYIKDLVVTGKHGVQPREKEQAQRFRISVELTVDIPAAATSDDLADTINYSDVKRIIIAIVQDSSFNLIERLAQVIGDRIIAHDPRLEKIQVSIEKLDVFESGIPGVSLEVRRQR